MAENVKNQVSTDDLPDYLLQHAGEGNNLPQSMLSTSYLQILQDASDAVKNREPGAEAGLWYVSGAQLVLGTEVEVIVADCQAVWDEKDAAGKTLDRYRPMEVEYIEQPNPKNPRFPFKVLKNGNRLVETCAYALILKDHPELGFVLHTAGVGSMASYRRWNKARELVIMPNGEKAACFAKSWILTTTSMVSKTTGKQFYGLDTAVMGKWTQQALYNSAVAPAIQMSKPQLMIADQTTAAEIIAAVEEDVG